MLFDTHAHYDDKQFDTDRDELLASLPENNIKYVLNAGCDMKSSRQTVKMCDRYPFMYGSVGIHPHDAKSAKEADLAELAELAQHKKIVAIGEIGLDYHYDFSPRDIQKMWFRKQIDLARELDLPIIIHEREACNDTINTINCSSYYRGVYHCFSGSAETGLDLIKKGFYLSFTGVVTFANARKSLEVIKAVPLERIMIETDCPYMAPTPFRGKRNSSLYVHKVAEKIAEIKGISFDEVARITTQNALELFNIAP